jgi:AP-1 complex subunit sigma 1/2
LTKWFITIPPKEKAKIVKDATQLVLARRVKMCNFLEYKGTLTTIVLPSLGNVQLCGVR